MLRLVGRVQGDVPMLEQGWVQLCSRRTTLCDWDRIRRSSREEGSVCLGSRVLLAWTALVVGRLKEELESGLVEVHLREDEST